MRVGILGGTFDPIHLGHLALAREARKQLGLEQVLFIPTGEPWLKTVQPQANAQHRASMVELAVADEPRFQICRDEIDRPGVTYTVDTLEGLTARLETGVALYFILGADALEQFHRWKQTDRILMLCNLAVFPRPGYEEVPSRSFLSLFPKAEGKLHILNAPPIDVSGTEIRERAGRGQSLEGRVPETVANYIQRNQLYGFPRDSSAVAMELNREGK